MYPLKNIIIQDIDVLIPTCMYRVRNPNESTKADKIDLNISNQVIKFLKAPNKMMTELEQRQDHLLKKLDILYDRIKMISSFCDVSPAKTRQAMETKQAMLTSNEIVVAVSPDNLPWFLNILRKEMSAPVNIKWHIHSSVPSDKIPKVMAFVKNLPRTVTNQTINLRLIFKCVSADSELILSSLAVPIMGTVNTLRYLSFVYPNAIPYNHEDYYVDALLDLCHLLERTPEKNKETVINKLFSQCNNWIYKNEFSIVDIAAYNVVKQWHNSVKYVPKNWFQKCENVHVMKIK